MTGEITNRVRVLARPETNGFASSDNASDDGAGAFPLDVEEISMGEGDRELLDHQRQIGENEPTPKLVGGSMAKLSLTMMLRGLASGAGHGVDANTITADGLDHLFLSFHADSGGGDPRTTTEGQTITAGTNATLTSIAASWLRNDLVHVYDAAPSSLAPIHDVARIAGAASPFNIDPNLSSAPDSGAAVGYGGIMFRKADRPSLLGPTLSLVVIRDGIQREFVGMRPSSVKLTGNARGKVVMTVELTGLSREITAYATLPNHSVPAATELQGRHCNIKWGDTVYDLPAWELDFGISQFLVPGTSLNDEGFSDNIITDWAPVFSFNPVFAQAWEDAFGDEGTMMLQVGRGTPAGGIVNVWAFFFERGQIVACPHVDDNKVYRNQVQISANSPEYPAALGGTERGVLYTAARF